MKTLVIMQNSMGIGYEVYHEGVMLARFETDMSSSDFAKLAEVCFNRAMENCQRRASFEATKILKRKMRKV